MKCLMIVKLLLSMSILTHAQIRTDYREGMSIPNVIDLTVLSPNKGDKLRLEKPFPNGYYTLIASLNNYREEINYIRLMNFEVKELLSQIWGKGTIAQKKVKMKNFLLSKGCYYNEYNYMLFYGRRWRDNKNEEYDETMYVYPDEFDNILTRDDTDDKYFGTLALFEGDITELLPLNSGLTFLGFDTSGSDNDRIIVQTNTNYADQYYMRKISRSEMNEIRYAIYGNYPRKVKENYVASMLISYEINNIGTPSSKWGLYKMGKSAYNGIGLDLGSAVRLNDTRRQQQLTPRSYFLEFFRSLIFTKEEKEWYNKHFTREQLDAITGAGLGIGLAGSESPYTHQEQYLDPSKRKH